MRRVINKLRLFLCTFSGEDDYIIRKCSAKIQISFAFIGIFVLLVFGGCFVSATAFITELFGHFNFSCLLIGTLWALIVTTIYLFLLYTISPVLLPVAQKRKIKGKKIHIEDQEKSSITISLIIRMIFILVLAIIIAQPLSVLVLSGTIESDIENYKMEYKVNMMVKSDSLFIQDEMSRQKDFYSNLILHKYAEDSIEVQRNIQFIDFKIYKDRLFINSAKKQLELLNNTTNKNQIINSDSIRLTLASLLNNQIKDDSTALISFGNLTFNNQKLQNDYNEFYNSFHKITHAKLDNYAKLNSLLDRSNFYATKIKMLLQKNFLAWILTLLGCLVFLIPIYLKFIVRNKTNFYNRKEEIERKMVIDAYVEFKTDYVRMFYEKYITLNNHTTKVLNPYLEKLKKANSIKYKLIEHEIKHELKYQPMHKYEYWADMPYRTKRQVNKRVIEKEEDLIHKIYNS